MSLFVTRKREKDQSGAEAGLVLVRELYNIVRLLFCIVKETDAYWRLEGGRYNLSLPYPERPFVSQFFLYMLVSNTTIFIISVYSYQLFCHIVTFSYPDCISICFILLSVKIETWLIYELAFLFIK